MRRVRGAGDFGRRSPGALVEASSHQVLIQPPGESMSKPLPHPKSSVIYREMDDGGVLYCTRSEVYFGVNPVGAVIWRALQDAEGSGGTDSLIAAVTEAFPDAPEAEVPTDVEDFLRDLSEAGLLEEGSPAGR